MINVGNNVLNTAQIYAFSLITLNGEEIDLIPKFASIEIFEDMYSYFLKGRLLLVDSEDMVKNLPIVGGEKVLIAFSDAINNSARFVDLMIKSVLPQIEKTDELRQNRFTALELVSETTINSEQVRVSRTFNTETTENKTFSSLIEFIQALSANNVKLIQSDSILGSLNPKIHLNSWNLQDTIDYILSQTEDGFFFETFDDFQFKSLKTLLQQSPSENFELITNLDNRTNLNTVLKFFFDSFFDISRLYEMGGFGKTCYNVDLTKYSVNKTQSTLNELYKEYPLLGNNQVFDKRLSSNQTVIGVNYNNEDAALKRNILLQAMGNHNLICSMNGNIKRTVGEVVTFNVPAFDQSIINNNYQGNWLITQIKHSIDNQLTYRQNIRLWKNAFFNNKKVNQ